MAALDFGMALARGMLPKAETAQKDLLNLAGGRNVFKSEDWWNTQVDKQIESGYREVARTAKDYLMPSGEYQREKTQTSFQSGRYLPGLAGLPGSFVPGPSYSMFGMPTTGRTVISHTAPEGAVKRGGQFVTRDIPIFGTNAQREDFTAGELSDIESAAKRGAEQAKRTSAETKSSKRRLSRATGGLMGKARQPGDAPVTGLPALGEGGLGVEGSILGGAFKL